MLEQLKKQVCEANLALVRRGLVIQTWGNASAIDRPSGKVVIKPSGVPYEKMKPEHMVVVGLGTGRTLEGKLNPSSDTSTHLVLYREFGAIGVLCTPTVSMLRPGPKAASRFRPWAPPTLIISMARCPAPACSRSEKLKTITSSILAG